MPRGGEKYKLLHHIKKGPTHCLNLRYCMSFPLLLGFLLNIVWVFLESSSLFSPSLSFHLPLTYCATFGTTKPFIDLQPPTFTIMVPSQVDRPYLIRRLKLHCYCYSPTCKDEPQASTSKSHQRPSGWVSSWLFDLKPIVLHCGFMFMLFCLVCVCFDVSFSWFQIFPPCLWWIVYVTLDFLKLHCHQLQNSCSNTKTFNYAVDLIIYDTTYSRFKHLQNINNSYLNIIKNVDLSFSLTLIVWKILV